MLFSLVRVRFIHTNKWVVIMRLRECVGALSFASIMLAGCTTPAIDTAERNIESMDSLATRKMQESFPGDQSHQTITTIDQTFILGGEIQLKDKDKLPAFFDEPLTYVTAEPITLREILSDISKRVGKRILLSEDASIWINQLQQNSGKSDLKLGEGTPESTRNWIVGDRGLEGSYLFLNMNETGSLKTLLDNVCNKLSLFWKYESNQIVVFRKETRYFLVDLLPGKTESKVEIGSQSSGAGGANEPQTGASMSTDFEQKNPEIYEEVKAGLESLKSLTGTYSISAQTGTVTYTDTPLVLDKVQEYISSINKLMTKKIAIKTEIYEVTLDDDTSKGLDLNVNYSGSSKFTASLGSHFLPSSPGEIGAIGLDVIRADSIIGGSSAFVNALRQVADVSLVTTSNSYTINGYSVPVQVLDTIAYVKSQSTLRDSDGKAIGVEIMAGTTSEGLSMMLLPKIGSKGEVFIQMSMDLSMLKSLETFGDSSAKIQLPQRSVKNFLQRVSMKSGESLILTGLERVTHKAKTSSIFDQDWWFLGGNKSGGTSRIVTVILITPYIISN